MSKRLSRFGPRVRDELAYHRVFIVAASTLVCVAVLAGWLPARKASRVDLLVALRHE